MVMKSRGEDDVSAAPEPVARDNTERHLLRAQSLLRRVRTLYFRVDTGETSEAYEEPIEIGGERQPRDDEPTARRSGD